MKRVLFYFQNPGISQRIYTNLLKKETTKVKVYLCHDSIGPVPLLVSENDVWVVICHQFFEFRIVPGNTPLR